MSLAEGSYAALRTEWRLEKSECRDNARHSRISDFRLPDYGTNTPCRANSVLSAVAATPSGPPSLTSIWPSAQIARLPSITAPGVIASIVVETEQLAPGAPAVAVHGTVADSGTSSTVAGSSAPGP